MYQNNKLQVKDKHKVSHNNIHTQSIRLIDFNNQWSHQPQCIEQTQNKSQRRNDTKKNILLQQQGKNKQQKLKRPSRQYPQVSQQQSSQLQLHPKKKAFSQLQTYKKHNLQSKRNNKRFTKEINKDKEDINYLNQQNLHLHNKNQHQHLTINSTRLKSFKLPQIIKSTNRENHVFKKIKLQRLQEIDIKQRIKNLKTQINPQHYQNSNQNSQFVTQSLKNKAQKIRKLNQKLRKTRNATQATQNILNTQSQIKVKQQKKEFQTVQQQAKSYNHKVQLKLKGNLSSPVNADHNEQQQNPKQNEQNNTDNEMFPKIEVYDKKMKIGRKKKKEQDRIRAMLIKTLLKTKGTDYVAQQGSSQPKKSLKSSRVINTQRSTSKDSKSPIQQRHNLVLVTQNNNQSTPRRSSLQKLEAQRQKLKRSLIPNSSRFSQQRQPSSNYVKNKKFVQMVRQVENRKKFFEQQLEEIKEQGKTITREDENVQYQTKIDKKQEYFEETDQKNEFLSINYDN